MYNFTDNPFIYATQFQYPSFTTLYDNDLNYSELTYEYLQMFRMFIILVISIYFYGFLIDTPTQAEQEEEQTNLNINEIIDSTETEEDENEVSGNESIITKSDIEGESESENQKEESEDSVEDDIPNISRNYETLIENMSKYDLYVFNRYFMHYLGIDKANFYRILRHITQYLSNTGELYYVDKETCENNRLSLQKLLPKWWDNDSSILIKTTSHIPLKIESLTEAINPEAVRQITEEMVNEITEEIIEEKEYDEPNISLKEAIMRLLNLYTYITEIKYPEPVFVCANDSNVSIDEDNLLDLFSKTNPTELMREFLNIFEAYSDVSYTKDFENFSRRIDPNVVSKLDIEIEKENCYENLLMMFIMSSLKTRRGVELNITKPLL